MNKFFKMLGRNLGEIYGNILKRSVSNSISGQRLPVVHPEATDSAITIVNKQRQLGFAFDHETNSFYTQVPDKDNLTACCFGILSS